MRERDEHTLTVPAHLPHRFVQRDLAPKALDREPSDQQHDPRAHEHRLAKEPRCAERDLGRRRPPIAGTGARFSGEALRDRRAVREMVPIDPRACEPSSQLGTGATREGQTSGELDLTRRLSHDHDAVARLAGDDRERARDVAGVRASRARADLGVKVRERSL